jgi:hypothetical protein
MELPPDNPKPIVDRLVEARAQSGQGRQAHDRRTVPLTVPFTIDVAKRIADADVRLDFMKSQFCLTIAPAMSNCAAK